MVNVNLRKHFLKVNHSLYYSDCAETVLRASIIGDKLPVRLLIWPKICINFLSNCDFLGTVSDLGLHASLSFCVLQQKQSLRQRFGTSKMHVSPKWLGQIFWSRGPKYHS